MSNDSLNEAIQFIQQGRLEQAQPILQNMIQTNPQDLAAWSWYVKTCRKPEERYRALKACLKFNPGNNQVIDAILKLEEEHPAFASHVKPIQESFHSQNESGVSTIAEPDTHLMQPNSLLMSDESPSSQFVWYEIWKKALTQPNVNTYWTLLRDPQANPQRAYRWIFIASLIFSGQSLIQSLGIGLPQDTRTIGIVIAYELGIAALQISLSVFGVIFAAAVFNLIAKAFGGVGNFPRTIYLIGVWAAPIIICYSISLMIILSVSSLVVALFWLVAPLFGILGCIIPIIELAYVFLLGSATIRAAHRLSAGQAHMVVAISMVLVGISFGIVFVISRLASLY